MASLGSFDFNDLNQSPTTASPQQLSHHQHRDGSPHEDDEDDGGGIPPNATVYQTTGPDAHTTPILASDGSGTPAVNPRSCVTCRRRKVRCDKQMPCTTCRRALIPCIFPAPGRKPRQPRPRDPNAPPKQFSKREVELVKRLKKLEGIVEELSGQIEIDSKANSPDAVHPSSAHGVPAPRRSGSASTNVGRPHGSSSSATGEHSMSPYAPSPKDTDSTSDASEAARRKDVKQQFGRLVLNDHKGRTKYVSSAFWSKMTDEIDALRREAQQMTDEETDISDDGEAQADPGIHNQVTHDHHAFLFGYRSADVDLRKLYPVSSQIWYFWKIYQDNVEPLIKVVHVPTTDILLREASKKLDSLSAGKQALVFAIFFAAVIALEPGEAETNFGVDKCDLVAQYRFATEQALAKADLTITTDFTVIQAMTIFLVCARRFDTSRFCWSMVGLLIRLAQGVGLHRDGSYFDLTPFETEMRRRVWWAIMMLDLRSSEELGTDLSIAERTFDTEMPSNIDDADISPESTKPVVPKEGRSDMSVQLLRSEITALARRILTANSAAGTLCPTYGDKSYADRERMLMDHYHTRMEKLIAKHTVDPTGDTDIVFFSATMISRVVMGKLYLLIYQPELFSEKSELSDETKQRIYLSAIEVLECDNKLSGDVRAHPLKWLFLTYSNWQAIAYALVASARRPWTPLSERCWEVICAFHRVPIQTARRADHAAVFLPLRKLFLGVRKHRALEIVRLKQNPQEALRLDAEERKNATLSWFGPSPMMGTRQEEVRQKWWSLVDPNGAVPADSAFQGNGAALNASQLSSQQQHDSGALGFQTNGQVGSTDMSDAQMQYLDQMMAAPQLTMAQLFSVQDQALRNQQQSLAPSVNMQDPNFSGNLFGSMAPQPDEQLPPFLLDNWFDGTNALAEKKTEDVMVTEDMDMLNGDFDWQDWSQVMKGMEMYQGGEAPVAK